MNLQITICNFPWVLNKQFRFILIPVKNVISICLKEWIFLTLWINFKYLLWSWKSLLSIWSNISRISLCKQESPWLPRFSCLLSWVLKPHRKVFPSLLLSLRLMGMSSCLLHSLGTPCHFCKGNSMASTSTWPGWSRRSWRPPRAGRYLLRNRSCSSRYWLQDLARLLLCSSSFWRDLQAWKVRNALVYPRQWSRPSSLA